MRDKSTLAGQQVPEAAYFKSSFSGGGSGSECLEVAPLDGGVRVRDTKNRRGPVLNFHSPGFRAFIDVVKKDGSFTA